MPRRTKEFGAETPAARVPDAEPEMPLWLSEEAKNEWLRVVPALAQRGAIGPLQRALAVAYCESWAQYVEALKSPTSRAFGPAFERLARAAELLGLSIDRRDAVTG